MYVPITKAVSAPAPALSNKAVKNNLVASVHDSCSRKDGDKRKRGTAYAACSTLVPLVCESANKDLSVSEVCGCPKLAVVLFCFFWLRGGEPGTHRTTIGFVQNGNKNTLFICHHTWGTVEAFPVLENVIS
jgi:hypothetical protein